VKAVSTPQLAVYRPAKDRDTGAAVVICPGDGFNILAYDLEGTEVADWLNSIGVTGIVLKYRMPFRDPQKRWLAPVQDSQRAMSVTRSRARPPFFSAGAKGALVCLRPSRASLRKIQFSTSWDQRRLLRVSSPAHAGYSAGNWIHCHCEPIPESHHWPCRPGRQGQAGVRLKHATVYDRAVFIALRRVE
jgi:hypothetical protein